MNYAVLVRFITPGLGEDSAARQADGLVRPPTPPRSGSHHVDVGIGRRLGGDGKG